MLGRTDSRRRLLLVLLGLVVISTVLVGRLAFWQVVQRDRLAGLAEQQTMVTTDQPSHRGTIYDRTGTIVLASTVDRSRLVAAPKQLAVERRASVAATLVGLLGLKGGAARTLTRNMTSDKAYVILAAGLSAEEDDIIDFCTERLARYKCPSKVMFVEELPHNITGKVLRRALR